MGHIIAVANQKGGVGKTTSTFNIAAGLATAGKKVLAVDMDPQGHLTRAMGYIPEEIEDTIADILGALIRVDPIDKTDIEDLTIRRNEVDLIPANIALSSVDVAIVTATAREYLLREVLAMIRDDYDYVLIDCLPSLGMLAINALTAADSVIVPIRAQYLDLNGFTLLKDSIQLLQHKTNKKLKIQGVFLTMYNDRLKEAQETLNDTMKVCEAGEVKLFDTKISTSTDAAASSRRGKNIFEYKPGCKVAEEYRDLVKEILNYEY